MGAALQRWFTVRGTISSIEDTRFVSTATLVLKKDLLAIAEEGCLNLTLCLKISSQSCCAERVEDHQGGSPFADEAYFFKVKH